MNEIIEKVLKISGSSQQTPIWGIYTEVSWKLINIDIGQIRLVVQKVKGKGKGTRYLTSEVPLLSREYSPRKPTEN